LNLEEFSHDFMKNIKKINSDLIDIGFQGREALILAKTVDSIQRRQSKISNLDTKEYKTGEAILPNLLNSLQDDLVEPNESKSVAHYSVDISAADSAKAIAVKYQDAVSRDDRYALRQMVSDEMSITEDCEQALLRGTASASTQLQIDKQGGSYLLIRQDNKNWLVPTFKTLKSFTTIQPAKGLFDYERDNVSSAELRRPAEVREDRGVWVVVNMGVVAVPA
jgi:hypothetical protein